MTEFEQQFKRVQSDPGFIAALDQSGGSTPKALGLYGVPATAWDSDAAMFDLVHQMRMRIMMSPAFTGQKVLGAILFEDTMNRQVDGRPTTEYLWNVKRVVPFLKVDEGLAAEADGIQLLKPIPTLGDLLQRARANQVFGTKMRSVIKQATPSGIERVVAQQFEIGHQIIAAGLVPILEPEVDIHCPDKSEAEALLREALMNEIGKLSETQNIMLKLTLPEVDNHYRSCIDHPRVLRVVALSGGYSRQQANDRLSRNHGMTASFSRALAEGLSVTQTEAEFNSTLQASIDSIFAASIT